jgi:hypothetical protein
MSLIAFVLLSVVWFAIGMSVGIIVVTLDYADMAKDI